MVAAVDDEVEVGWFDEPLPTAVAPAAAADEPATIDDWMALDPVLTLPKRIDWSARRLA